MRCTTAAGRSDTALVPALTPQQALAAVIVQRAHRRPALEFLVNIEINWPADGDPARKEQLFAAELARGQELARAGVMKRLWRVPGRWANWGLWEAEDATALHDALSSLPLWPWMSVTVHPLARHVNDPASMDL